jgi:hypothetical protein
MTYSKKYSNILLSGDIKEIDKISPKTKNTSIKALIILSKYLGINQEFKAQLKSYGIKLFRADALGSFMRLYNNPSSDLMDWYNKALSVLRPNEQLFLQFLKLSGLRKEEGIMSFNKIIELSKQDKLNEYYSDERCLLEHFKYKEVYSRNKKYLHFDSSRIAGSKHSRKRTSNLQRTLQAINALKNYVKNQRAKRQLWDLYGEKWVD